MNEWIDCSKELPDTYVFCLVYERRNDEPSPISIARWEGDKWNGLGENNDETNSFYSDLFWDMSWDNITHWMELPKEPDRNR